MLVISLLAAAAISAQTDQPTDSLRERVRTIMKASSVPSIVVAVAQAGKPVWVEAFGYADQETVRPATTRTPFLLASVTKPIVATAVARMVARGVLKLDEPVTTYLPEL